MEFISNIWNHPKTSVAGLLIAVATVASVLSQQGITLGNAGTGTVVTLASALATALLGLLSKDPGTAGNATSSQAKFSAWLLVVLVTMGTLPTTGCSATTVNKVVSEINAYLPTAVSLLNEAITIYSAVGTTGQNTSSSNVSSALTTVSTDLTNLKKPLADYLAAASSANKTSAWSNIKALVDTAVNDSDTLLSVAKVSDSNSKEAGTLIIASLDAAVHILDGYVTSAQSKTEIKAKLAKRTVKLAEVERSWSVTDREQVAHATGVSYSTLLGEAERMGF